MNHAKINGEPNMQETEKSQNLRDPMFKDTDDIIIQQTNERIMQDIAVSSSFEVKASIMLGIIGVIFTIMASVGLPSFITLTTKNVYFLIPLVLGFSLLAIAFCLAFAIVKPRDRLKLLTPRKINNASWDLSSSDMKYHIRHNLIRSSEFIEKELVKDGLYLKSSIGFFISAIGTLSIPLLFQLYIGLISKISLK